MTKVVINNYFGGFSISKECAKWLEEKYGYDFSKDYGYGQYYFDEDRHNKHLVEAIETLGSDVCSGDCATLELVECNSGMYRITDYDGYETLHQPTDEYEWVVIND